MNLRSIARRLLRRRRKPAPFPGSADYWERRYRVGGNSGAGSYNRLARFKADFLNRFVRDHDIQSVIEFGSGDGAQLELADYPAYIGVDVSQTIIGACREKFRENPRLTFLHSDELPAASCADLSLSLDVIYHLVEDPVFDTYMRRLFDSARRYVIVYASNEEKTWASPHVRHRRFTDWVDRERGDFRLIDHIANAYPFDPADPDNTSFADFYVFERR